MNQMLIISSYKKHGVMNTFNAMNGELKEIVKLVNGNVQASKGVLFRKETYGAGVSQVSFCIKRIRGQTTHFLNLHFYCNCSLKGSMKLRNINYIRPKNFNFIFKRIYNLVLSEKLFILAYQNLKAKKR